MPRSLAYSGPIDRATELDQASFEHLFWTLFGTSSAEQRIRAAIRRIRLAGGDYAGSFKAIRPAPEPPGADADDAPSPRPRPHARPSRPLPPRAVIAGKNYALDELYLKKRAPSEDAGWAALYEYRVRLVGEMHRAGVPIMVGTATCGMFPGFSVHDELRNLVDAGLSARDALRAATTEPAEFLGSPTGRIAPGRAAGHR